MRIGIEAIVDLFADEIEAKGDEGDAKARGGVTELIGEQGMLPPRIPSSEELCRIFSRSHFLFQFSLSFSLSPPLFFLSILIGLSRPRPSLLLFLLEHILEISYTPMIFSHTPTLLKLT